MRMALLFCALLHCVSASAEGVPELGVEAETSDIFFGESLRYRITIKNMETPVSPDISGLNTDFDVESLGNQSQNQQSIFFANGQMTKNIVYSHIYDYRLTPRHAGQLAIPAPFALVNGTRILGRALPLTVRAQEKQDIALLEIVCNRPRVYPTQPFDLTLRILLKPLPDNDRDPISVMTPPELNITWLMPIDGLSTPEIKDWLSSMVSNNGRGFSIQGVTAGGRFFDQGLAVLNLFKGRESRKALDGSQINYYVYELTRRFTPQKIGSFSFGPVTMKGTFVDGVQDRHYAARRLVVSTPAKSVEVREVPPPVPPTFCGGVGKYTFAASAAPLALRVGDPLTLKLEVERQPGSGSLDLLSAPNIANSHEMSNDFDIIDKSPTGHSEGDKKTFSYALRPKRAGVQIPGFNVTTFDPETEHYIQANTEPIKLTVTQAAQVNAQDLVSGAPSQKAQEVRNRTGGLFQNFADLTALQDQRADPLFYGITAAALWTLYGLMTFVVSRKRAQANDLDFQRRRRARPEAEQCFAEARAAIAAGKSAEAIKAVRSGLVGLIGNMLNIPPAGMTAHEASGALSAAGASAETRNQAIKILETIEGMAYTPAGPQDADKLLAGAEKLIPILQRELGK